MVLDEPTAALDPIAEAAVYENFNVLTKYKNRRVHQPQAVKLPFLRFHFRV